MEVGEAVAVDHEIDLGASDLDRAITMAECHGQQDREVVEKLPPVEWRSLDRIRDR